MKVGVVGSGPAGLQAALSLQTAGVETVLIGRPGMSAHWNDRVDNILGCGDVSGMELILMGISEFRSRGGEFIEGDVFGIKKTEGGYNLEIDKKMMEVSHIILATGRTEHSTPEILRNDSGSITSLGINTGKIIIAGNGPRAVMAAMKMKDSGRDVTLVLTSSENLSGDLENTLAESNLDVYEGEIEDVIKEGGITRGVVLSNGRHIEGEAVIAMFGQPTPEEMLYESGIPIPTSEMHQASEIAPGIFVVGDLVHRCSFAEALAYGVIVAGKIGRDRENAENF